MEVTERMVNIIRHFYEEVVFIVPDVALSAGTIFVMSGDEIMMDYYSCLRSDRSPSGTRRKAGARALLPWLILEVTYERQAGSKRNAQAEPTDPGGTGHRVPRVHPEIERAGLRSCSTVSTSRATRASRRVAEGNPARESPASPPIADSNARPTSHSVSRSWCQRRWPSTKVRDEVVAVVVAGVAAQRERLAGLGAGGLEQLRAGAARRGTCRAVPWSTSSGPSEAAAARTSAQASYCGPGRRDRRRGSRRTPCGPRAPALGATIGAKAETLR